MSRDLNTDFKLGNCLYRAAKLTTNDDPSKYGYSGYGIEFDARSQFPCLESDLDKNVIFAVDDSSSMHVDNKKRYLSSW